MVYNEKKNRNKRIFLLLSLGIFSILVFTGFTFGSMAETDDDRDTSGNTTVLDLNEEIKDIKQKIKDLEAKKEEYQQEITELREQSLSLEREIILLDNRIAQLEIEIEAEQAKIDQTGLEIQNINFEIESTEKDIKNKKAQIGNLIRKLDRIDNEDYLSVILFNDSFSQFFDAVKYLEDIEGDVFMVVGELKTAKAKLEEQKIAFEDKKKNLESFKEGLEQKKLTLEDKQDTKAYLLSSTRLSERKFHGLIAQIKEEQENANAEIVSLEKQIRVELAHSQALGSLGGDETFSWPAEPSRGISAYFHDPDYPYRYLFEHPGIDIRTPQGTSVRASKSGYVARAKDAGMGYSYIMLIHDDDFTTVYGHVSQINVKEDDFIVQGQIIGRSGGMPGTPGAGKLSTGPHLHFEIRANGIPVNPLDYLP